MLIKSFKQAWQLLRQNRLYSTVYILATGLSISMVMVLAILFYLKIANIYPETNRDRLLVVEWARTTNAKGDNGESRLSLDAVKQCVYSLQTAEATTAIYGMWGGNFVQPDGSDEQIPATVKYVDIGFWQVFPFSFIEGKPFSEADMESGIRTVVISESFARQIFNTSEVTGSYLSLNFEQHRICGVVKDPSYITDRTFGQLWMPYTAYPGLNPTWAPQMYGNTLGSFTAYILAPSAGDIEKVRNEARENFKRFDTSLGEELSFSIYNQPERQWQSLFSNSGNKSPDFNKILLQYALLFFIFLLIPAISLSGMADSQMERRLSEMGIRRAFGARQKGLIGQLISENLVFTILGGLTGLLFSYSIVYFFRRWIIHIGTGQRFVSAVPENLDVVISPDMLINYTVFGIALLICLILNLMVTVIPAWRASSREIVYSLNNK